MSAGFWVLFGVWLVGGFIFHQLERRLSPVIAAYRTGFPRRGYVADVISSLVNGPGLTAIEKIAFTYAITLIPAAREVLGGLNWWLQFAIVFVVNDFGRYWLHRWYHEFDILWRIHRVHHTVTHMDAMSVFRHHVLEAVVKNGLLFLPLRLLGIDDWAIIAYSCVDILKGYWHHANLRTYIGPLNYLLNSPELHWWHHSVESRGMNANYGSTLSIWDWLFRTAYYPKAWPDKIGVEGLEAFPEDFVGQLTSIAKTDGEIAGAPRQRAPASGEALDAAASAQT